MPYEYVLTTKDDPAHPQYIVLMSNWNVAPEVNDAMFEFTPPRGREEDRVHPHGQRPHGDSLTRTRRQII